ncbi:MAG: aminotransferase class III-fold pyridoxal phosphate-dependent enzyme, partial [Porcipelethomonas sp.]
MSVSEIFENTTKKEVFDKSIEYWNSGKTKEWLDLGIDLVIGKREGYYFWDMDGKKLMDVHINGGTYSLGHRNQEVIDALVEATKSVDIGNHHFPSPLKAKLAETVIKSSPEGMKHVIYGSSGGEVIDLAIKCARSATNRLKVVCVNNCYHGHTGLAVAAGAPRYCDIFHAERPGEF